ncbi:MAG: DUF3127 domain-containing protein [Bacteroidales bacterium]|nr:DUF3127 domain-containing protein [Bacteroidales bacterium]
MEIQGKIIKKLPLASGEGRNGTWRRQEYVLEYGDRFPKQVCFSLMNARIDQYPMEIDEEVIVSFDIESREYNGRYYTSVSAWKVDKVQAGAQAPQAPVTNATPVATPDFSSNDDNGSDDLPF